MDKQEILKAVEEALQAKGSRKFTQSVDLAINFKDVDFKKPENRINADVVLPFKANELKVGVFADGQVAQDAKKVADLVITSAELPEYAGDKKKQKELLNYTYLAQPQLMAQVGKTLGQVLGAKGKLPKPLLPNQNLKDAVEAARRRISLRTKGKYLPTVHCIVGKETLTPEQIAENILAVLEAVKRSVSETQIKNICIKLTMGKPVTVQNA